MKFFGMEQIIWYICLILFNSWCFCQNVYFKLENEDTSIVKTNEVQPFLDESVESEMECYMKCLGDQDNCCLIEMKETAGKFSQCLLYSFSPVYVSKAYEKHSRITSVVDKDCKVKRKSCLEWYEEGKKEDGVYEIDVNGKSTKVSCDMLGGGWTTFQNRFDGSVDFNRTWSDYKNGFGDVTGEYWLGNDLIHQLTNKDGGVLIKIKTKSFGNMNKYIIFRGFKIDDEENKYQMHIGDAVEGDDYLISKQRYSRYNNGAYFTTKDVDNDNRSDNCATYNGGSGGYWYKDCSGVKPIAEYPNDACSSKNMVWLQWKTGERYTCLKSFKMSFK